MQAVLPTVYVVVMFEPLVLAAVTRTGDPIKQDRFGQCILL